MSASEATAMEGDDRRTGMTSQICGSINASFRSNWGEVDASLKADGFGEKLSIRGLN